MSTTDIWGNNLDRAMSDGTKNVRHNVRDWKAAVSIKEKTGVANVLVDIMSEKNGAGQDVQS